MDSCQQRSIFELEQPVLLQTHKQLGVSDILGYILNLTDHMLILFLTVYISWKCLRMKLEKTAFHAFTCTLGFVFLLAEGVMMRYSRNVLALQLDADTKHKWHYVLLLLGGVLGIIGTLQKMWGKKQHFTTLHGKFGIAACVFCALNFVVGAAGFWLLEPPSILRILHNVLGLITLVTALVAQYYGYNTGFFRRTFPEAHSFKGLTVIILMLTIAGPLKTFIRKLIYFL